MNHDIVFISFSEDNAEQNWQLLLQKFPKAKRVHGIKGIRNAHLEASKVAKSDFFFTIDGDNQFFNSMKINVPKNLKKDAVYVWRSQNSVNKLIYGYGGLKLWSKESFKKSLDKFTDHAMSATKQYIIVDQLVTKTVFNTSALSTWRSAFRESAKLAINVRNDTDKHSKERAQIWMSQGAKEPFGSWCLRGAREGYLFSWDNLEVIVRDKINDFSWLSKEFELRLKKEDDLFLSKNLQNLGFVLE